MPEKSRTRFLTFGTRQSFYRKLKIFPNSLPFSNPILKFYLSTHLRALEIKFHTFKFGYSIVKQRKRSELTRFFIRNLR